MEILGPAAGPGPFSGGESRAGKNLPDTIKSQIGRVAVALSIRGTMEAALLSEKTQKCRASEQEKTENRRRPTAVRIRQRYGLLTVFRFPKLQGTRAATSRTYLFFGCCGVVSRVELWLVSAVSSVYPGGQERVLEQCVGLFFCLLNECLTVPCHLRSTCSCLALVGAFPINFNFLLRGFPPPLSPLFPSPFSSPYSHYLSPSLSVCSSSPPLGSRPPYMKPAALYCPLLRR